MTRILLLIFLCFVINVSDGQTISDKIIKAKGDSVLRLWVGKGIKRMDVKFKEGYHDSSDNNDYRATYIFSFPENKYSDEMIIYFDSSFNVVDSNFFRTFPDYILENRPNDLISKDSAIEIAKKSGLCTFDIMEVSFYRLYDSKIFAWVIRTDSKKERAKAKREQKGVVIRRTSKLCQTRTINAKTGEIITEN